MNIYQYWFVVDERDVAPINSFSVIFFLLPSKYMLQAKEIIKRSFSFVNFNHS